jgi:aminoglycoside 6'-N-acetyltransferase I
MQVVDLKNAGALAKEQAARILVEAFKVSAPNAWPTLQAALQEVEESFGEDRISRAALDENGRVVGWIGGIDAYDGHAWELHPLAVDPQFHGQRIGTALVQDFENLVRAHGATTIWLGSDDESNQTSLGGVDVYPEVLQQAANIKNLRRHAFGFYQKMGYVVVGLIPDANGFGKPDILMAKRISEKGK